MVSVLNFYLPDGFISTLSGTGDKTNYHGTCLVIGFHGFQNSWQC